MALPVTFVGHHTAVPELYCLLERRILYVPKSQDTLRLLCEGDLTHQSTQESTWLSKPFSEDATAQTLKPQLCSYLTVPHITGVREVAVG